MYWLLAHLFGPLADLFYRRTQQGPEIGKTGPLLIVANHPNGLIDPVLLIRDAGRRVRFLAKEPLFRMPIIGALLRRLGALPVYRPTDGHDTKKNDETFRVVFEAFAQGDAVAVFPEGTSHSDPSLKPLKTGAARMVLGAESQHDFSLGVRVLPVGLLYRKKAIFRSEAVTVVGEEIDVGAFRERYEAAPKEAVAALTTAIDEGLREVTVNLERWEDQPLFEMAARIWRPDAAHPLEPLGRVASGDRRLREHAPERLEKLRERVFRLRSSLGALGMSVEQLDRRYRPTSVLRFVLRNLIALLVGMPLALVGAAAYFIPYQLVRLVVFAVKPGLDLVATYKVLLSLLVYPVWHSALVGVLAWKYGAWAAFVSSVSLPFAGLYTQQFIAHRRTAGREIWAFVRRPFIAGTRSRLVKERDLIRKEMNTLAREYETQSGS